MPYDEMGAAAIRLALADAGIDYDAVAAGVRRLRLRRLDLRPARDLQRRHDRHPGLQRQQQLLHRFDRAVPGAPGRRERHGRLRARASASSRCSPARSTTQWDDRPNTFGRFDDLCDEIAGGKGMPLRAALLRWRRRGVHEALRHQARNLRQDPGQGAAAMPPRTRSRCSARCCRRRRGDGLADDLARRADPADGLPADLRRGRGDPGFRRLRAPPRPAHRRAHPGPGDDDRHARPPSTRAR